MAKQQQQGSQGWDPNRAPMLAELRPRQARHFQKGFQAYSGFVLSRNLPVDENTGEVTVPQQREYWAVQNCLVPDSAAAAWFEDTEDMIKEEAARRNGKIMDVFWEQLNLACEGVSAADMLDYKRAVYKPGEEPLTFGLRLRNLWQAVQTKVDEDAVIDHFLERIGAGEALQQVVDSLPQSERTYMAVRPFEVIATWSSWMARDYIWWEKGDCNQRQ